MFALKATLVAGTAAMLFGSGVTGPAPVRVKAAGLRHHRPVKIARQRDNASYDSTNWSGYAVTGVKGSVTDVKGSWVVPTATCSTALGDSSGYSSFWVGIDGFNSNTVEQIGTDSDCVSLNGRTTNQPTYYAWFEFYPQNSYIIEFSRGSVTAGDLIEAEVSYSGTTTNPRGGQTGVRFTVTFTDVTKGLTYSSSSAVNGAEQTSAEWIAEAPCCGARNAPLPLADFGTVSFSANTATVAGVSGAIGAFGTNVQNLTMVGENSTTLIKALPSALSSTGGFSVAWENPGP